MSGDPETPVRPEAGWADPLGLSDWGGSNDVVAAAAAGGTLEMPAAGLESARSLVSAVESGELSVEDLDARAAEMLALVGDAREPGSAPVVDADAHHALARRVAARSAVLLKNENALLPLPAGTRVAVIGDFAQTPRYQGAGSSAVNPTRVDSVLDVLDGCALEVVGFAQGFARGGAVDAGLQAEAVAVARSADVALLFLGLDEIAESEGMDRSTLALPTSQIALLSAVAAVNPNVVVVLSAGGVVEMPWLASTKALVHGYLAGQAGAGGLLDVLTGVVNPSGRLAETVPVQLADTPCAGYFPGRERSAEYREGLYVGYRYYTTADVPVTFPFGYGLSYTTFAYDALSATVAAATVTVTNTGAVAGADVVQVYVHRSSPGVARPARALVGFARVSLEPGASETVTVPLGEEAFRHWDVGTGAWVVERGTYEVLVGSHVDDLPLSASVEVPGVAGSECTMPTCYRTGAVQAVPDTEFAALLGRALPSATWTRAPLGPNDALCRLASASSLVGRLAYRVLAYQRDRAARRGKPDLNVLFLLNMPFRAMQKMAGGAISAEMVDGIVRIVNGSFFGGIGAVVRGYVRNRRANRRTARELGAAPGREHSA